MQLKLETAISQSLNSRYAKDGKRGIAAVNATNVMIKTPHENARLESRLFCHYGY